MCAQVSVIIPVYNAEKYITQCIESLLNQTLAESEFIFVNDGSRDHSRQIIERFQKFDARIKLINQDNHGVSAARNSGISIANGEFIGFVDADDYVEKDMYEILYQAANQGDCDVVVSNFEGEIDGHRAVTRYPFPVNTVLDKEYIEQKILPYLLMKDDLNTACNKIYKYKVLRENNIRFPAKVLLGEDGMFNKEFFARAVRMKYIDYTGYHYKEVDGSATRNILEKDYFKRALEIYDMKLPAVYDNMDMDEICLLSSMRLIKSVMSNVYIYFKPSDAVSIGKRYRYVKDMICNERVRSALAVCYDQLYGSVGRYDRFLLDMIKRKSALGLYCATAYSRLRNK